MATLLIDADIMVYKITSSVEEPVNWDSDLWTLHCDFAQVKKIICDTVDALVDKTKVDEAQLCFSDKKNFRKDINIAYKLSRKKTRKPMCFVPALEYCKEEFNCVQYPMLEADDVMGILASKDDKYIIYSEDKDMYTIPGLHWDISKEVVWEQSKEQADYHFYTQTLTGDATDGYPGCPGIGPKKAEKILESLSSNEMWDAVVETYKTRQLGEHYALLQARMARILRDGEYVDNQPILWSPYAN